ncbi:MAG: photosynthetic reaction center cytochrome PufC [Burkholderiaceae bacterium]|jgi:photosynthetic reaction center cytochrome c subunit|nr:photosynthetic reaction center cytochrome c subunit [Burkholderiales bacterium]MCZ8337662.1 photosynthetic reaction center cytochrome PufC [Burkholderiaceae bacterium]
MSRARIASTLVAATVAAALLSGCERPPPDVVQSGFRGTGMEQVYNPRRLEKVIAANEVPPALDPVDPGGPKAGQVYQNVKVLGDLGVGEFTRLMVAMTNWVAPKEGPEAACVYCHNPANLADDSKYTKIVARSMIQMTRKINGDWKAHVANTGVTCYTCHRGQPVPQNVWFKPVPLTHDVKGMLGDRAGQNSPATSVALASLPYDPFGPYLSDAKPIRVIGKDALPNGNRASTKQAEFTYGLMMHMSDALGVNCTYCHNTRSMAEWDGSPPQRATAWYGIRMARSMNNEYMEPLTATFPAHRKGPLGDVAKINCATCHQGAYKPLFGAQMAKDHPELGGVRPGSAAAAPAAPVAVPAAATAPTSATTPSMGPATVFFAVGSSAVDADGGKVVGDLAATLKANPGAKVSISGFHSASGNLAQNQELAKSRAFAVRDGLIAAGIAADRIVLEKPMQTEANISGEDRLARRVDVAIR